MEQAEQWNGWNDWNAFTARGACVVFSGEAKSYREPERSLPAKPIVLWTRDASAGSTEVFQE